ncbi:MAG: MATE family efflux transporter [Butyricicoccus sp.]|nr:MATE family efflux transporter [Butyricicoccus sp.]
MNDLTVGKPIKILLRFSLPMLISMIFQQMYNVADSVIAGQMISVDALAAIGAAYPATVLFLAVATGASVGCSVIVSLRFGQKDMEGVKSAVYTAFLSLTVLALVLTGLGFATMKPLLRLIGTPTMIFHSSLQYLYVYLAGVVFVFLYNTATAVFNALGDSRTPLYFLIFSSVLNVVLDLLFVVYIKNSVLSLAWATLLAQGVSSVLATVTLLYRVHRIPTARKVKHFDRGLLPIMAGIAIPSICQQSFVSVGIFLVQGIINDLGSVTVAAFSASLKISTFACVLINTLPTALTSYASQNIGAGRIDRVQEGVRGSIWIAEGLIVAINVLFFLCGEQLVGAFVSGTYQAEVIEQGARFLHIVAPFYTLIGVKNCYDSVLRGGGAMKQFMATTFADLALRVVFSYACAQALGFYSICLAYPFGWVFGTLLSVVFFHMGRWKHAPKQPRQPAPVTRPAMGKS